LQRVYHEFHKFVTVRLPDPNEDITELEQRYDELLERKHTVNESVPQLGEKWFDRAKEDRSTWEPKPLSEITGEDGEFIVEEQETLHPTERVRNVFTAVFRKPIRWLGY
jgi:hypothetical protein